jgi:hypothetical protein
VKKIIPFAIAALMVPGVAFAKGPHPSDGTQASHGKARVTYVLRGMIYGYTAYDASTSTAGSITIDVSRANRHGRLLAGQTITISTSAKTRVRLKHGVTSIAASQPGDRGEVKVRAPRLAFKSATLADVQNALLDQPSSQIVDRGPVSSG